MTIFDYLPPLGSFIRFRAEQQCGNGKTTRLVRVEDLNQICAENSQAKISVSYAALRGGQSNEHVLKVYSVCIDLDGLATRAHIAGLQRRFPGAALVHGNGLTLIYRIPAGIRWRDAALLAYQIGREAQEITGLTFDRRTLLRDNGEPGKHENHLFRFHAGWAAKRKAPVDFYERINGNSLTTDAHGLIYALEIGDRHQSRSSGDIATNLGSCARLNGGSLAIEHNACSLALRIRRQVLMSGGSREEAVVQAVKATGKTNKAIRKMFSTPGYEPRTCGLPATREYRPTTATADVGVIGLESSSRRVQRSRTLRSNFGHSLQSFWDVKCGPEDAFKGALAFPEFDVFRRCFFAEFGTGWEQAMKEDVQRCWEKFGERRSLRPVSRRCLSEVGDRLARTSLSAPTIAKDSGYSLRQVKRALKEMLANGVVTFTGRTKAKIWLLNPCHTEELLGEGALQRETFTDLQSLTRAHAVDRLPILWSRAWETPKGCPTNTRSTTRTEATINAGGNFGKSPTFVDSSTSLIQRENHRVTNQTKDMLLAARQIDTTEPESAPLGPHSAGEQCQCHPALTSARRQRTDTRQPIIGRAACTLPCGSGLRTGKSRLNTER